jgi:geranylgeranyl reductase family protein
VESFDAIIVGGGPAGSSCAWKLRQAGRAVLILDSKQFPRVKPCAGWITPQVVEALQLDVQSYRQGQTWQPITGFRCGIIDGREVEVRYQQPISYGILRRQFDAYLLKRCGAELRLGQPVASIERGGGGWLINGQYTAPLLIGAGGNFCPVARWLGGSRKVASVVFAQEAEYTADPQQSGNVSAETPAIYFCPDLLGYGWCFRKGDYLNVGLGRVDPSRLSTHVADFCRFASGRQIISGEQPDHWLGHAYRLYEGSQPVLFDDGVLLIGDAAGLAYPQSGEGIRPAVESALIAADVSLQASGNYSQENLASYEQRLIARLGRARPKANSAWLPAAGMAWLASKLLARRWFCRRVVMDQWFLHRHQPALS